MLTFTDLIPCDLQEEIILDRIQQKKDRLSRLAMVNDQHCFATEPVYGKDLHHLVDITPSRQSFKHHFNPMKKFVNTSEQQLENLNEVLNRFFSYDILYCTFI